MAIYLLVKEHAYAGLKYLCKHVASSFSERGKRPHVIQSGSKNNNAKVIQTPYGTFGSISEASQQIEGHTYKMIWDRLQNDSSWRYIKFL